MDVSLVAHCEGTLFTVERDPSIPLGDFMTELMTPTPCWRLHATDAHGHKEVVLDTLLADPRLLEADRAGVVVVDQGRAHLRSRDGTWRVIDGVKCVGGPNARGYSVVGPDSVVLSWNDIGRTTLQVLDRATGEVEAAPDLPSLRAIAVARGSIAWVNNHPFLATRDLLEDDEPSLVDLPSEASYVTSRDDLWIAVLEHGLAIVRGDDVEVQHPKHRFVQAWAPRDDAWYALLGGYAVLGKTITEHVGACLCRLRDGAVEPIWAETPPPIGRHFQIGALKSVAFSDERIYLVHAGEVVEIDPEGPIVQPVHVT